MIKNLFDRGIKVHIFNKRLVENTATDKLILTIISGFAEFERDIIVERAQKGKRLLEYVMNTETANKTCIRLIKDKLI
ncbi:recombinase family protein [Pullulanibacillus camelliae]|uniref:recombinase family protein n=1 Tax=Pullulanibacillus camelliae TaxID=1707096 RepID=UPI0027E3E6FF|nr:recombinase family protein [Pullulanibacillus camelliae]